VRILGMVVMVAASGCDFAFPLEAPPAPDADLAFDRCSAGFAPDGLRYAMEDNPTADAYSWSTARSLCLVRGMDLAVFNDIHELGTIDAESWPIWIGETVTASANTTVDGCPALGVTAGSIPKASGDMCVAVMGPLALGATTCDGSTPLGDGTVQHALCETPRPTTRSCLRDPSLATYTISPTPMTFADARTFCLDHQAHVAVIDSGTEWRQVGALATQNRVWLGSTFDGTTWNTDTGCPAVYSWTSNRPDLTGGTCLATSLRVDGESQLSIIDGMSATACTESAVYALCESD
jgi:hypothetical protein